MRKLHPDGTIKEWKRDEDGYLDPDWIIGNKTKQEMGEPFIICDCGNETFQVSWWDYPWTGGYCKVVCAKCGESRVLIDDYA